MSSDVRRPWAEIAPDAHELVRILAPACERIEIAGSARRGKSDVADAEIVCIPRIFPEGNALHWLTDTLLEQGRIEKALLGTTKAPRWGAKYRALMWKGVHYDLFIVENVDSFGFLFWLRTGPGDGNQYVVTQLKNSKTAAFRIEEGAVWQGEKQIPVRTEADWFKLLNIPFLQPAERTLEKYQALLTGKHTWGNPIDLQPVVWDERYRHESGKVWVREAKTTFSETAWGATIKNTEVYFTLHDRSTPKAESWMRYHNRMPVFLQTAYEDDLKHWKAKRLPVADYTDAGDLDMYYCMASDAQVQTVAIADLKCIESTYCPATVAEYVALGTLLDSDGNLPLVAKFEDVTLLMDGEHRRRAAVARGLTHMRARVCEYDETFAQACGIIECDEDDDLYADVLEEALAILLEAA